MRKGYGSGVWIKGMDHAVSQGMDQGMDRGVWIVCGPGAFIPCILTRTQYIYIIYIYVCKAIINHPQFHYK